MTYSTPLFIRIDEKKQSHILKTAGEEFARSGYAGANINVIADVIGISVGSLYKYFGTKENLFLAAVENGRRDLENALEENRNLPLDFAGKLDNLIGVIQHYSRSNPSSIGLYAELTAVKNSDLARILSRKMEAISADYYTSLIDEAQKSGIIKNTMEPSFLAFYLDNLFMNLQFSYAGVYYQERMNIFLGDLNFKNDEKVRKTLLEFILTALSIEL